MAEALEATLPRRVRSAFWPAALLGVSFVIPKVVYTPVPRERTVTTLGEYLRELAVITQSDLICAVILGAMGGLLLVLTREKPAMHRAAYGGVICVFSALVAYSVASYPLFMFLRSPLTYGLLDLYGLRNLPSLAMKLTTLKLAMLIIAAPMIYLSLIAIAHRFLTPSRPLTFRVAQLIVIGLLVPHLLVIRQYWPAKWEDRDDRRIAENPHWVFAVSCFRELSGRGSALVHGEFPPEDLADFGRISSTTRPMTRPATKPTPGLKRGPKNVILIVLESVSTKYMGLYGSKYPTTPRLQAESKHGLVFDNIYSPVTNSGNAMVAITLGKLPPMTWRELIVDRPDVPGTAVGNVVKERGYRTAFISSCDFAYAAGLPFMSHRGFQTLWDFRDLGCERVGWWGVDDRCMVDSMLKWIDQDRSKPFYIMGWNQGTHHPFDVGPGHREIDFFKGDVPHNDWDLGRYLNAIHNLDAHLGRLFDELRRRRLENDTIVVLLGDHGEAFGRPHPYYGHSGKTYQEDVSVPFIIWSPALFKDEPRRHVIGNLMDTTPTILDLLGVPAAADHEGRSLFAGDRAPRTYFYGAKDDYLLSLREHNWKFITNVTQSRDELYDLSSDPDELKNLAKDRLDLCRRYRQRLAAWVQRKAGLR